MPRGINHIIYTHLSLPFYRARGEKGSLLSNLVEEQNVDEIFTPAGKERNVFFSLSLRRQKNREPLYIIADKCTRSRESPSIDANAFRAQEANRVVCVATLAISRSPDHRDSAALPRVYERRVVNNSK